MSLSELTIAALERADAKRLREALDDDDGQITAVHEGEPLFPHFPAIGATALQIASFGFPSTGCAELLLEAGATLDLCSACGLGRIDDLNEVTPELLGHAIAGFYPMQYAIAAGNGAAVTRLLTLGDEAERELDFVGWFTWEADVPEGLAPWTPTHMAVLWSSAGDVSPLRALLAADASTGVSSPLGQRPIHLAATVASIEGLRTLVGAGVPVDEACDAYPPAMNERMPNAGDYASVVGVSGRTPLMIAAAEGHADVVRVLLELDADPDRRDSSGRSARDYAEQPFYFPNEEVSRLLA